MKVLKFLGIQPNNVEPSKRRRKVDFKKETITLIDIHGEGKPRLIVRDAIVSNKVDPDKVIRVRTKQPDHKKRLLARRVRKLFRTFVPRSLIGRTRSSTL